MTSYRSRYDELQKEGAQVVAVSGDKEGKQAEWKLEIGADFAFVADAKGALMSAYGVKLPIIKISKRVTFVIGKDRKILHLDEGSAAVSTDGAVAACSLF